MMNFSGWGWLWPMALVLMTLGFIGRGGSLVACCGQLLRLPLLNPRPIVVLPKEPHARPMPKAGEDENEEKGKRPSERPLPTPARAPPPTNIIQASEDEEAEASSDPAQKVLKPRKPPTRQDLPFQSFVSLE